MNLFEIAVKCVKKMVLKNEFVAGVILFGSVARGEESERSDVDLLVLWEGLDVDAKKRHVYVYRIVSQYFPSSVKLTVLDMEYSSFLRVRKLTPLLLNIIYDGVVLYDKYGLLEKFLSKVREELKAKGVKRVKLGKYYYWKLPKPGARVGLEV